MKSPYNGKSPCEGFTLIEILVAITILAMIFSIVFGTFFYTVNNAEKQEERAAIYQRANFILNNISQCVSSAYVPFAGSYPYKDYENPVFAGTDSSSGEYDADSLGTFTANPRFGASTKAGELTFVGYEVVAAEDCEEPRLPEDENNPLILKCTAEPLLMKSDDEDGKRAQWSLNIRSLNIEYFDGSDWIQEWNYEDQGVLPNAVRIELELGDSDDDSHAFSTIAYVHVNTLLEEPPEDLTEETEEEEGEEGEEEEEEEDQEEEKNEQEREKQREERKEREETREEEDFYNPFQDDGQWPAPTEGDELFPFWK